MALILPLTYRRVLRQRGTGKAGTGGMGLSRRMALNNADGREVLVAAVAYSFVRLYYYSGWLQYFSYWHWA